MVSIPIELLHDLSTMVFPKVTRFEVIDSTGRAYAQQNLSSVMLCSQDAGQTLKLFLKEHKDD